MFLYTNPFYTISEKLFDDLAFSSKKIEKSFIDYTINDDKSITFYLDVPGVNEDNLSIEVKDYVLTVNGERKMGKSNSTIKKSFHINKKYDLDSLKAELNNGVLSISINEKPATVNESRKIPITVSK